MKTVFKVLAGALGLGAAGYLYGRSHTTYKAGDKVFVVPPQGGPGVSVPGTISAVHYSPFFIGPTTYDIVTPTGTQFGLIESTLAPWSALPI